jgi:hypothetical protein
MQQSHFAVVCSLGAMLGLFIGFVVFSIAHGGGTGAAFAFWIQRPSLFWPWPMFGAAIAGLSLYAVWIFRRPRKPLLESRTEAYYSLIAKAVEKLPVKDRASRYQVYARAYDALAAHVKNDELAHEQRELQKAVRRFEQRAPRDWNYPSSPLHQPATASLVISIMFFPLFWVIDVTCLSLYWVARIPNLKKPLTSARGRANS